MIIDLETARNSAINKFNKLKTKNIICPALKLPVRFWNSWFSHITYKDSKHRRNEQEQLERFKCFIKVDIIIKKSHLYQEHMMKREIVKTRNHWITKEEKILVDYYWLVWVVFHNWLESRIKVVLRKAQNKDYLEYFSIIPAWNLEWYRNFIWIENW